ncbi:ATP-binding protein [Kineococcus glutinatus]|uniref:Histidine kinase/HSP90-like ATPase domain-containing protein n=1 Tax=Kineococcus glutinatus TaxID=1070872 RepID=A0ABP9I2M9_9ACTN
MCDVTAPAELTLPMDAQAPGRARSFLHEADCQVHQSRVLDEAQLLVSELVTNAVVHGAPPVAMRVECDGTAGMTVAVSDGSVQSPIADQAGPDAEHGRGIALVDLLSERWGVDVTEAGKTTWFRLRQ